MSDLDFNGWRDLFILVCVGIIIGCMISAGFLLAVTVANG